MFERMEDENDLLYGDLEATAAELEIEKLKSSLGDSQNENELLKMEIIQLKQQISVLVDDKATLERNLVAIYNTAMREIQRKDVELASYRQKKVQSQVQARYHSSSGSK
jgi:hypothetical protein